VGISIGPQQHCPRRCVLLCCHSMRSSLTVECWLTLSTPHDAVGARDLQAPADVVHVRYAPIGDHESNIVEESCPAWFLGADGGSPAIPSTSNLDLCIRHPSSS
jgi:hypothetical protein